MRLDDVWTIGFIGDRYILFGNGTPYIANKNINNLLTSYCYIKIRHATSERDALDIMLNLEENGFVK
jgi:hypothetical protein